MMQTLLANLRLWTGRLADAEQFAERALAGFREMNDRYGVMQALVPLNRARAGLGQEGGRQAGRRGVDRAGPLVRRARAGAAGRRRGRHPPRPGRRRSSSPSRCSNGHRTSGMASDEALGAPRPRPLPDRRCRRGDGGDRGGRCEDFPFGRRRGALVRAVAGDLEGRSRTPSGRGGRGASYFDLSVARLAGVLGLPAAR